MSLSRPLRVFTNWEAELKAAEETGIFSVAAKRRALNWNTDPVGREPAPIETELIQLGYDFYDAVVANHVAKAKRIFDDIAREKARLAEKAKRRTIRETCQQF